MPKREGIAKLFNWKHDRQTLPLHHKSSASNHAGPSLVHEEPKANESNASQPDTSTITPAPISCWNRALEKLKNEHGQEYKELKNISNKAWNGTVEPTTLIASAEDEVQKLDANDWRTRRITRQVMGAMTSLEKVFKAVAVLDPNGGASIACAGVFAIAQMALVDMKQYQFALTCVANVSSTIERWIHFEQRSLNNMDPDLLEIGGKFKDSLTDLHLEIMIHLATMAAYWRKSNLGMNLWIFLHPQIPNSVQPVSQEHSPQISKIGNPSLRISRRRKKVARTIERSWKGR